MNLEETGSGIGVFIDRDKYENVLGLKHTSGSVQKVYLFRVQVYNPDMSIYEAPVSVLAEDSEGAVRQATSGAMNGQMYGDKEFQEHVINKSIVTRERLRIRGWGNTEF